MTLYGSMERVSGWFLSDDLYGDERERLRWYEGMAVAANIQWIVVPWAATVLVWTLGRPAVLPLAVVMALMYIPTLMAAQYVQAHRVETAVVAWTVKRVALSVLSGVPNLAFLAGCLWSYDHSWSTTRSTLLGALIGAVWSAMIVVSRVRSVRAREAAAQLDDVS